MSLTVRFKLSHRERLPEWIMAFVVTCRGINSFVDSFLDLQRHEMDSPFFTPLLAIMDQREWGIYAFFIGMIRLTFLSINGSKPRGSTILRTTGAGLSGVYWFGLTLGAIALPYGSGAVFTYGGLMAFDLFALWYAAGEIYPAFARREQSYGRP